MKQQYHHGALRAALLVAAEHVLERDGIKGLTLRAVSREAGVSHTASTHHFGDLTGLMTALAASGFVRLREQLKEALQDVETDPRSRLLLIGGCYVAFARGNAGLFRLMFRSERLDWSSPELANAGQSAFAYLTEDSPMPDAPAAPRDFSSLVVAMSRWSLMHGLASLLVDGRVEPMVDEAPGGTIGSLIDQVLARLDGYIAGKPHSS